MRTIDELNAAIKALRQQSAAWNLLIEWLSHRREVAIKQLSEIDNEITMRRLQGQVQTLESILDKFEFKE